ncbi:zinc ribbon domain-containing protein [Oceanobacillus timonensis]|uniref:zinc ribbon domain-containing protein n=1 Tax=Oceanobacillus timonensis TaxID=1926285 RepID=UPI0015C4156C|nr:zinc ribbon domain-containing protein [Oceanobacillus timonensis]
MPFCSQCGKENDESAKFCNSCGNPLNVASVNDSSEPVKNQNANSGGNVYAILGWVFAGLSILFFPILFAGGAAIFGYLHRKVNKTHGTIIIISAIACGIFGVLLGIESTYYY